MVSLAGLSAAFPGYQSAETAGLQNRQREYELREAELDRQGLQLAGLAFNNLQSRPLMQPGQASVPMTQPPRAMAPQNTVPPTQATPPWAFAGANVTGLPPMEQFVSQQAQLAGVDPATAQRVAYSEGLTNYPNQRLGDQGQSGGPMQLYTGGGLGNEFQKQTGLNPLDARNDYASTAWALENAPRTGWTPYHGAARVGVGAREGLPGGTPPTRSLDQVLPRQAGIQDVIDAIESRAPNAPPELKMRALQKMMPLMKMDDRAYALQMQALWKQDQLGLSTRRQELAENKETRVAGDTAARIAQGDERLKTPFQLAVMKADLAAKAGTQKFEDAMNMELLRQRGRRELQNSLQDRIDTRVATDTDKKLAAVMERNAELKRQFDKKFEAKEQPTLPPEAIDNIAKLAISGDTTTTRRLAPGDLTAVNKRRAEIASEMGLGIEDQINNIASVAGAKAAAQTAGRVSSQIEIAAESFNSIVPIAQEAYDKVQSENWRTRFPTINKLIAATDAELGDPNVIALRDAVQGLVSDYAQIVTRGKGVTSVNALKRADEVLSAAHNPEQWAAAIRTLQAEAKATKNAVSKLVTKFKFPEEGGKKSEGGRDTEAPPAKPFTTETLPQKFKALNQAINDGLPLEKGLEVLRADGDSEEDIARFKVYREKLEKQKKSEAPTEKPQYAGTGPGDSSIIPSGSVIR